jgi:hypothetical protein
MNWNVGCLGGRISFQLVLIGTGGGDPRYLIDNADIGKLLETISQCTVDLSARH